MTDDKYSLFAVEDKVRDQLEAANPEPIIEEVVSIPFCLNVISSYWSVSGCHIQLFSFFRIWRILPQENQTGKTILKISFQPVLRINLDIIKIICRWHCDSESRDLKRDVAKKLEKLERRTQRAIAELIR